MERKAALTERKQSWEKTQSLRKCSTSRGTELFTSSLFPATSRQDFTSPRRRLTRAAVTSLAP